jgi:hypothetical protein
MSPSQVCLTIACSLSSVEKYSGLKRGTTEGTAGGQTWGVWANSGSVMSFLNLCVYVPDCTPMTTSLSKESFLTRESSIQ